MATRWSFFEFDWARFREIKPVIQAASETGDFTDLKIPGATSVLDGFSEDSAAEEIANALVMQLCGQGDALFFEGGLPELLHRVRKQPQGEEVAEILGELVSAEPNIEDWFRTESGLVGILTDEATLTLSHELAGLKSGQTAPKAPKGIGALTRRFTTTEPAGDRMDALVKLVTDATGRARGIGVLREG